ncbi:MAG: ABC transporter ATP-binding protein [Bifidobacterium tibiigranuli]|jgi:ABC-type dipeptide/oligopeptide/nickel transport system ATPase component|uniref:ABC transporter ATP-binding protein n=1 Tax=Bifidobacterium tibiigranuli TaxID=2172043 RepID=UPI0023567E62|nr:ABC transporter ATP-binding protein [Bifidobacterium tibiigranuli]MCH3975014.1 ABC transporter ATP-binding protein [Bifidobacterium tibiigranuli]MCH4189235.1 ABC transporter ATP-binding protein [Bifidobacterium tibiigranuli]MCH4202774.1 ABC transporter ATP-binding protein [Bifidobacterium tibiigranuli]MCH4273791.1 ABC transporter ATP-binding protein [Bifidobacterium tibiigranuli]MCI1791717.1 ABC transporter ATP-binding protein [Bifidobacterium tibiigranuli]
MSASNPQQPNLDHDSYALRINDLCIEVESRGEKRLAVDNVNIAVSMGESYGLVGESGSGKSLTLRAVMGLLNKGARLVSGTITVCGKEVINGATQQYDSSLRGSGVSMVFQEPAVALNPIMKVGQQIIDSVQEKEHLSKAEAKRQAIELMDRVGITDAKNRFDSYPFELSGGMRQRVMIAAAIACKPKVLLCDEPTTALDVTIQQQILQIFEEIREAGTAILYVTHDLAVVSQLCTQLSVIYQGKIVEHGRLQNIFDDPQDDYTKKLLSSTPYLNGYMLQYSDNAVKDEGSEL